MTYFLAPHCHELLLGPIKVCPICISTVHNFVDSCWYTGHEKGDPSCLQLLQYVTGEAFTREAGHGLVNPRSARHSCISCYMGARNPWSRVRYICTASASHDFEVHLSPQIGPSNSLLSAAKFMEERLLNLEGLSSESSWRKNKILHPWSSWESAFMVWEISEDESRGHLFCTLIGSFISPCNPFFVAAVMSSNISTFFRSSDSKHLTPYYVQGLLLTIDVVLAQSFWHSWVGIAW